MTDTDSNAAPRANLFPIDRKALFRIESKMNELDKTRQRRELLAQRCADGEAEGFITLGVREENKIWRPVISAGTKESPAVVPAAIKQAWLAIVDAEIKAIEDELAALGVAYQP